MTRWTATGRILRIGNLVHAYKYIISTYIHDWGDSEMHDSPKIGELRFRSKTKAGPLEDKQLSRAGNIIKNFIGS